MSKTRAQREIVASYFRGEVSVLPDNIPGPRVSEVKVRISGEFKRPTAQQEMRIAELFDARLDEQVIKEQVMKEFPNIRNERFVEGRYWSYLLRGTSEIAKREYINRKTRPYIANNNVRISNSKIRAGQTAFSKAERKCWNYQCPITGTRQKQALEPHHIDEFSESHDNSLDNGILLRADIHKLVQDNQIRLYPKDGRIVVSVITDDPVYAIYHGVEFSIPDEIKEGILSRLQKKLDNRLGL